MRSIVALLSSIARLVDHPPYPAEVDTHEPALPLHDLPRDEDVFDVLVSIRVTTVPGTLFIGDTLIRSVASMMMSASLPGVSVPIVLSKCAARVPRFSTWV